MYIMYQFRVLHEAISLHIKNSKAQLFIYCTTTSYYIFVHALHMLSFGLMGI